MAPIKIPAKNFSNNISVTVILTGYRRWIFKIQIAIILIRLACWIAGFNYGEDIGVLVTDKKDESLCNYK